MRIKLLNRIEYEHLFKTLSKFGFGPVFVSWIQTLYAAPQARVRTNNFNSQYFTVQRGTRQGCPLSPLLFDLVIEPLAAALRCNNYIRGIMRGGLVHKVSLYADDLLMFISDLETSIPESLDTISQFGKSSGYKINLTKSVLFPINVLARNRSFNSYPFRSTEDSMTYLGVSVTSRYKDLFQNNFKSALGQIKENLNRWSTLPLSLAGRINSVKMVTLPKILYLFQTVPIFIPKSFFKELDRHISTFIWNKTMPGVRKTVLQRCKENAVLALPNFLYYYWAANIHKLVIWYGASIGGGSPSWCLMEQHSCSSVSLASML
uniref:Reverse transcriptase domain-containing protein n=1 Tax=Esox lucius TaxID=8010 RepID=A0AAY5JXW3_ESOLU